MENNKDKSTIAEMHPSLCVSPKVVEMVPPEEVSVAVLQHLRNVDVRDVAGEGTEKKKTDTREIETHVGFRKSVYQTREGIQFWIVTEMESPFITVSLPDEWTWR